MQKLEQIVEKIWQYSEEENISFVKMVLQIHINGYGAGDKIAGVRITILRKIAKQYKDISLDELEILLKNELHEARFIALVILIAKFKKYPKDVVDIYLNNTRFINNWDLVDISAPHIVGEFCVRMNSKEPIWKLANSENLWENRISIVASWAFIKKGDISLTIDLAKHLMNHRHHLIHKAIGWMLREVGKKDQEVLIEFLKANRKNLPKITYSYAKERIRELL